MDWFLLSDNIFTIDYCIFDLLALERYQLDFWFPPDARRIQANEHFQGRIFARI